MLCVVFPTPAMLFAVSDSNSFWDVQSRLATFVMCLAMFSGSVGLLAALTPMVTRLPSKQPKREWSTLHICLVTKGVNRQVVLRSVEEMRHLHRLHPRVRFVVLTEEGRDFDPGRLGVDVVFVPQKYQPPKARFKARSLEYFRAHELHCDDDWVLHLDEETGVDEHSIRACIEFIERTPYRIGQGIILYNSVNYWEQAVLTLAEIIRFREDLGRFNLQHGTLRQSIWGVHGSFLLLSAKLENEITWDTTTSAEDFWFSHIALGRGYRSGFIPSAAREQSPWTVMDFLRQRRRWSCGIWLVGLHGKLVVLTSMLPSLELPIMLMCCFGWVVLPSWVAIWAQCYYASGIFSVMFATLISDLDAGVSALGMIWHTTASPLLAVPVQLLQTAANVFSIVKPTNDFYIVEKQ